MIGPWTDMLPYIRSSIHSSIHCAKPEQGCTIAISTVIFSLVWNEPFNHSSICLSSYHSHLNQSHHSCLLSSSLTISHNISSTLSSLLFPKTALSFVCTISYITALVHPDDIIHRSSFTFIAHQLHTNLHSMYIPGTLLSHTHVFELSLATAPHLPTTSLVPKLPSTYAICGNRPEINGNHGGLPVPVLNLNSFRRATWEYTCT